MRTNYPIGKSDRLSSKYVQTIDASDFRITVPKWNLIVMEETALSTFSFNVMEKNIPVFFFLLLLLLNNFRYKVINIVAYQGKHFEKKKKRHF